MVAVKTRPPLALRIGTRNRGNFAFWRIALYHARIIRPDHSPGFRMASRRSSVSGSVRRWTRPNPGSAMPGADPPAGEAPWNSRIT
jgi:hypothetical protein